MIDVSRVQAFKGCRVHLGVCGSVAAYKSIDLMRRLQSFGIHVSVTITEGGKNFVTPLSFLALGALPVYSSLFDELEPFAHLDPGAIADIFAIIPATANIVAKITHGVADDMLSAQALAFSQSLIIAPAMNPRMWNNASTQANIDTLRARGHSILTPDIGHVACGDEGEGRLPERETLTLYILRELVKSRGYNDFQNKKVLVTLGPTREQWDAVRCWTNLSTGYMGASFVYGAWLRGAEVHAVTGPGNFSLPKGVNVYPCISARDMFHAVDGLWDTMDYGIFTAAVADYSPEPFTGKFKKADGKGPDLRFMANKDILATMGARKKNQKILGFAAESSDLENHTLTKMKNKNADIMAGNLITNRDTGFGSPRNEVFVCVRNGASCHYPQMSKEELAWKLLTKLCEI